MKCALLIYLGICLVDVEAQLIWNQTEISALPKVRDTNAVAVFRFKNNGPKPVVITAIKSSCGCTTAKLTKTNYAPSETGQIDVNFNFGDRVGLQTKTITVETDDVSIPKQELAFKVAIPKPVALSPLLLNWAIGDAPLAKIASLKTIDLPNIRILRADSMAGNFKVETKTIVEGAAYEIVVTPMDVSKATSSVIKIETDSELPRLKTLRVYAFVRDKPPG